MSFTVLSTAQIELVGYVGDQLIHVTKYQELNYTIATMDAQKADEIARMAYVPDDGKFYGIKFITGKARLVSIETNGTIKDLGRFTVNTGDSISKVDGIAYDTATNTLYISASLNGSTLYTETVLVVNRSNASCTIAGEYVAGLGIPPDMDNFVIRRDTMFISDRVATEDYILMLPMADLSSTFTPSVWYKAATKALNNIIASGDYLYLQGLPDSDMYRIYKGSKSVLVGRTHNRSISASYLDGATTDFDGNMPPGYMISLVGRLDNKLVRIVRTPDTYDTIAKIPLKYADQLNRLTYIPARYKFYTLYTLNSKERLASIDTNGNIVDIGRIRVNTGDSISKIDALAFDTLSGILYAAASLDGDVLLTETLLQVDPDDASATIAGTYVSSIVSPDIDDISFRRDTMFIKDRVVNEDMIFFVPTANLGATFTTTLMYRAPAIAFHSIFSSGDELYMHSATNNSSNIFRIESGNQAILYGRTHYEALDPDFMHSVTRYYTPRVTLGIDDPGMATSMCCLKIYPNPASGMLTIDNRSGEDKVIRIISSLGTVVREFTVGKLACTAIDVGDLAGGVYFVRSDHGESMQFLKVEN